MPHADTPDVAAKPSARRVAHRWPLISGLVAVALAVGLGALIFVRDNGSPLGIDTGWMSELAENRAPVWDFLSLTMNVLGGGIIASFIVPGLVVIALLLARRPWAAGYFLAATVLTGVVVQLLKNLFGRARPDDILVRVDFGSFPSGHVANAAVTATILALLFPRVWVWLVGLTYTIVMMVSRTYLGAHWLTDTIGALLLGIGIAVLVWAPLAAKIDGERELRVRKAADGAGIRHSVAAFARSFQEKYLTETRYLEPAARRRLYRTAVACVVAGVLLFSALLLSVLGDTGLTVLDKPVQSWLFDGRSEAWTSVMITLAILFGPVALPLIVLVVAVVWGFVGKHAWRPLVLAGGMITGVILGQIVGRLVDRQRPPTELMLFGPDPSFSFPSGHVLGAADFVLITAYLVFSRQGSIRAAVGGYTVAVVCIVFAALSRLYLGYHWVTDALASVSLSLVVLGCVIAYDTRRSVRVSETVPAGASPPTIRSTPE